MASAEIIRNRTAKVSEFIEAYDFEVYDIVGTMDLLAKYRPLLFASIGLYLLGIYYGQKWMKNRPAYKLNTALFLWNAGLSILSIIMVIRTYPETSYLLSKPNGLYLVMCSSEHHNYATSFWGLIFLLSKFLEFGDTAFIVLRKQKLIVLHWFHHVATLLLCWFGFEYYDSLGRVFFVNAFVHSFMYPYYALKALKVKIPRKIAMAITTLQILQMLLGVYLNFYSLYLMALGHPCLRHKNTFYLGGVIIPIFAVLFVNFFLKTYSPKNRSKIKPQ